MSKRHPPSASPATPQQLKDDLRRVMRWVVLAFVVYHSAAVSVAVLPEEGVLSRIVAPAFRGYSVLFGLSQRWNMFSSPPLNHDFDVIVTATDKNGAAYPVGCLIPGLLPYDKSNFRYHTFFTRLSGEYQIYQAPYIENLKREAEKGMGIEIDKLEVKLIAYRINPLPQIRRTHKIATPQESLLGQAP